MPTTPGPTWALPPAPPESWGVRRGVVVALVVLALAGPVVALRRGDEALPAVALAVAALAGLAAAVALVLLHSVRGDARLLTVASGAAAVPLVAGLRAVGPGDDPALALVQWSALPLLAVAAALAPGRRGAVGGVVLLAGGTALAVLADGLVTAGVRTPLLAALELALAVGATGAGLLWLRRSPADDAGPHGWVAAGLALTAVLAAARAVLEQRTGGTWHVLTLLSTSVVVVPALGLAVSSCRPYRRQSRRWRQLETQVRALRASSPLVPGPSITPEDEEGLPSAAEVRALLDNGVVAVALQPVVQLADGRVVGHEALARFGGRVPTDRWFRGAGLHGLAEELELLTVRTALRALPGLDPEHSLAVNLSPLALASPAVLESLESADLSRVVVEITEHEAVRDYAAARMHLGRLRAGGARIAVDDIGAGFASLRHALLLRPDVIKLDQSLTRGIDSDARQRAVVVAVTRFAEEVGVELIAEGVETPEQATALQQLGLVLGQGWGLGVPVLQRDLLPGG